MTKKLRRVPKDKKTGIAKKYLNGSKNRETKGAEKKRTEKAKRKGEYSERKDVKKWRIDKDVTKKIKKTTQQNLTKRT